MKKILLVDDHAPTRLMFSQILAQQDASYDILEASNGREACETALVAKPDLILMDVLMPVMDGYEGYPLDELETAGGVVNDTIADRPVVVLYDSEAQTGVAYLREVDGQTLEFYNVGEDGYGVRDRQTDSLWDVHGRTVEGAYWEAMLEFVPSFISEWYGWSAYHPESQLYRVES